MGDFECSIELLLSVSRIQECLKRNWYRSNSSSSKLR